jgi:para-aminobenzoate synthetase component I
LIALSPEPSLHVHPDTLENPFTMLRNVLNCQSWGGSDRPPVPFIGGWVGYLTYDLAHWIERLDTSARVDHSFPLMEFAFCRRILAYDHTHNTWTAIELLNEDTPPEETTKKLENLLNLIAGAPNPKRDHRPALSKDLQSNFSRKSYERNVQIILEHIANGDVYQVNFSQRFEGFLQISPEEMALRLLEINPEPFSAFLSFSNRAIVSSSPERFLRVHDRSVEAWPIKGTCPRGVAPEEDERFLEELLASEKDRAELIMITDLLRNDLGRVCIAGSVKVPELRKAVSHNNVHHTYSRVTGRLNPETDLIDLLQATFPGGSVTGAPKIKAMEIIEALEPTTRGPYCGAIGYIGVDGTMDLNIAIRTVLCEGRRVTFQVGGGIVAESRPSDEFEETHQKAKGILKAFGINLDNFFK